MNIVCSELDNLNISLDYFNSIKQVSDDLIKYLKNYKQLNLDYMKKLQSFQTNFRKKLSTSENPKIAQVTSSLTNKLIQLIDQGNELLQLSLDDIDLRLREFDSFIKVKNESIKSVIKSSSELNKLLLATYNEANKAKANYLNSLSKTEEIINKYYSDQNKIKEHENGLGPKLNDNEYILLKQQQKSQYNEMTNSITNSKKLENVYKNSVSLSNTMRDKFINNYNAFKDRVQNDTCELSEQIKVLCVSFMLSYKNNYKQPMNLVDVTVNDYNALQEGKVIGEIISSKFKNDNSLKTLSPENYNLKSLTLLKSTDYIKDETEKPIIKNSNSNILQRKKTVSKLEDGLDEMKYIQDEPLILTIKVLFDNFGLIEKGDFNLELEEGKNRTQKYILKISANMNAYPYAKYGKYSDKNKKVTMFAELDYKRFELSTEEIADLTELLNVHENRIIFLQKLSDYRTRGKFFIPLEDYTLLAKFLNIIIDKIRRDMDYHAAEMVIILSQTYYMEEGKRKKYIQETIKENKTFKDKGFWEEFLVYTINKEIEKTLKRDEKVKESKANFDTKISNLVFGQVLTLIDNMFEFDVEDELIKELLGPKISYYKLNDSLKNTINEVIESKREQKKIDKEEIEKSKKLKEEEEKRLKEEQRKKFEEEKKKEEEEKKKKEEENKEENKNNEENNNEKEEQKKEEDNSNPEDEKQTKKEGDKDKENVEEEDLDKENP